MNSISVDELLQLARQQTGLSDFGPADFLEGLTILVDGLNHEAAIREDRWPHLRQRLLRLLVNRLWFAKDSAEHPEIADEDPGAPIVISSLPRTGSTKLHRLLGASGDFQVVTFWKAHMYSRIPELDNGGIDRRIQETRDFERWMYETSPAVLTGHPMFTDEPEEDQWLVESTFRHPLLFGMFDSPRYAAWLQQADLQPTFNYFVSQIRYLQWQSSHDRGKPWLLKTPNHLGNERYLSHYFKTPRFIITHRDPALCIPSITTAAMAIRRLYSDRDSSAALAAGATQLFAHAALEHMRWRDSQPDVEVLDLGFREINQDGIGAARKVYEFLGLKMSSAAESRMREWEEKNHREKHGKSHYSSEGVGTTDQSIRHAFEAYMERFSKFI